MLALLIADLRSIANLAVHRAGRRVVLGAALSLGFLFLLSDAFGRMLAADPGSLWIRGTAEPPPIRAFLGIALAPGLLLSTWFAFAGGPRQLFELPQLPLWLQAPIRVPAILLATWLRFGLMVAVWCAAVTGPLARRIAEACGHELAWWHVAVASCTLSLTAVAPVLALQVVLLRFFSGRWTRVLFAVLSAIGSLTFSLLLLIGALGRQDAAASLVEMAEGRARYPAVIDVPAGLMTGLATHGAVRDSLMDVARLLGGAAVGVALVSLLYRRAWANAQRSVAPLRRRFAKHWPSSAAAVVFRKEVAQLAQNPGQLLGLLVSTLFVVVLASSRLFGEELFGGNHLRTNERAVFVMLATWLVALVTIVPGCVLRMALLDGAQWGLFQMAPASRAAILVGKLFLIAMLQVWPAFVAAIVGIVRMEAGASALSAFAAVVPVGVLWSTGVSAFVGTLPGVIRPRPDRNPALALVAVALAILILQLSAIPGGIGFLWLAQYHADHGPLAGLSPGAAYGTLIGLAWATGLPAAGLTAALAARQLRRLTRPER